MHEPPLWGVGIGPKSATAVTRVALVVGGGTVQRVTTDGAQRIALAVALPTPPAFFVSDNATSDGGNPWTWRFETNPFQPSAQGGENVFHYAHLMLSWSAAATVQVTPFADDQLADVTLPDGSILRVAPSLFVLAQQGGTLQRARQVFTIPLIQRVLNPDGSLRQFFQLRGERVQLLIQSMGTLGVGEIMVEGIDWESVQVRKSYGPSQPVTAGA